MQLVQSNEYNKVMLFKFSGEDNNCRLYQRALRKANVQYEYEESSSGHIATELNDRISGSKFCKVIIVEITHNYDKIGAVTNCHMFIDDFQGLLHSKHYRHDCV